jgi:stage II sporulation protein D
MRKQPVLNVGIMSETHIDFILESVYHHGNTTLQPGLYSIGVKGSEMILQGNDVLMITDDQIVLLPVFHTNSFLLKNVTIGIQFHWEQKEDQRFTGGLRFIREDGKIRVINTVYLENYLKSVISSEMSATASMELLKAHAVISRSWLIAQMDKNKRLSETGKTFNTNQVSPEEIIRWYDREDHQNFDVCADDHCQRYQGITKILSVKAIDAVDATFGKVLVSGEEICDARFSKCCGGISESFENVWEPEPKIYLNAITDHVPPGNSPAVDLRREEKSREWIMNSPAAFCNTTDEIVLAQVLPDFDRKTQDFFRWKTVYSQDELSALIKKRSGLDFGRILRLESLQRGFSGRISRLRIVGTNLTLIVGKELEIRKWLSPSHLYSSAFYAEYKDLMEGIPGKIILHGAGWGHGVGLCQIGAAMMGEMGYLYEEILNHYFQKATIEIIYNE